MDKFNRRQFLQFAGAAGALSISGCAGMGSGASKARVVVVGGGYGGATVSKYLRLWDPGVEVVMVERSNLFTSCPMSNLVIGGNRSMNEIQRGYDGLRRHGVQVVNDEVTAVDAAKKTGSSSPPASTSILARSKAIRRPRAGSCTPGRPESRRSACASSSRP
jgi:sulfide dehydrogenase [flavocytochrome c] flavoprotein chain